MPSSLDVPERPRQLERLTACPDCDLLLPRPDLLPGHRASCPRCGRTLGKRIPHSLEKTLALSLTGLILYLPAMLLPLLSFNSLGFSDSANILESVINFYQNEYYFVALMVLLSTVVFPLCLALCSFLLALNLRLRRYPAFLPRLLRCYQHLEDWAMLEIYLLGILVTIVKMSDSTGIVYHFGIVCFTAVVLCTVGTAAVLDRELFWRLIEEHGDRPVTGPPPSLPATTARGAGLLLCRLCHKLASTEQAGSACSRCGETLQARKVRAQERTWALIISAAIFFVPANILPIMRVDFLGIPESSTIIDGIRHFFASGSFFIGLIILVASVLVPVCKIVGLSILLLARRPCSPSLLHQKTRIFRLIVFIGRWSMLDIFVIALLAALVDFGLFTAIHIAPAATYFAMVVATTMFAASTYDPRLMWDRCIPCHQPGLVNLSPIRIPRP